MSFQPKELMERKMEATVSVLDKKLDEVGMATFLLIGEAILAQRHHSHWRRAFTEELSLPSVDRPQTLQRFLAACVKGRRYSLAVAVSVLTQRHRLVDVKDMVPQLDDVACEAVLNFLVDQDYFDFVPDLVALKPHLQLRYVFKTSLVCGREDASAEAVTQLLLQRYTGVGVMTWALRKIVTTNRPDLFEKVIESDVLDLSQVIMSCSCHQHSCRHILNDIVVQFVTMNAGYGRDLEDSVSVLSKAIEWGLATHESHFCTLSPWRPFSLPFAVEQGLLDLLKLLYRSGGATNAQLTILSRRPEYQAVDKQTFSENPGRVKVNEYLRQAARHPRRLLDLCIFRVSHLIGCRADRKLRLAGLPNPIADELLFKTVIHDFHTDDDTSRKKDPPGLYYCKL